MSGTISTIDTPVTGTLGTTTQSVAGSPGGPGGAENEAGGLLSNQNYTPAFFEGYPLEPLVTGGAGGSGARGSNGANGMETIVNHPGGSYSATWTIGGSGGPGGNGGKGGDGTIQIADDTAGAVGQSFAGQLALAPYAAGGAGGGGSLGGSGGTGGNNLSDPAAGDSVTGAAGGSGGAMGAGGDGGAGTDTVTGLQTYVAQGTTLNVNARGGAGGGPLFAVGASGATGGETSAGGVGGAGGNGGAAAATLSGSQLADDYYVTAELFADGGAGGSGGPGGSGGLAESFFTGTEPGTIYQTANGASGGNGGNGGNATVTLTGDTIAAPEVELTLLAEGGGGGAGGTGGSSGNGKSTPFVTYDNGTPGATGANGSAGAGSIVFTNNVIDVGTPIAGDAFHGSSNFLLLSLEAETIAGGSIAPVALNGGAGGNLQFSGNDFVGTGNSTVDLQNGSVGSATIDAAAGAITIGGSAGNTMSGFSNFTLDTGDTFIVGTGNESVTFASDPDTIVYTQHSGNVSLYGVTASNMLLDFQGFGSSLDLATLQAGSTASSYDGELVTTVRIAGAGTITLYGVASPLTSADVQFDTVCYLAGTHILTPRGEVRVETLRPGDLVTTASGAHRKLRWVGSGRTLVTARNRERATPVVVRRGALADNVPHRDLYITRGHSLYLDGALIPVEELVNHRSIAYDETARVIEYYHLETDTHDVVLAEGAPAETYREDGNSPVFLNAATRPDGPSVPPYAPVLHDHATVRRVWQRLSDRAGRPLLRLTENPDVHLLADGVRCDGERMADRVWRFRLPGPVAELRLMSRSAIPAMLGIGQDQRRLGVAVRRLVLRSATESVSVGWDADCLGAGFHAPEPAERHRWTNGAAMLPVELCEGATAVEISVVGLLPYPVGAAKRAEAA